MRIAAKDINVNSNSIYLCKSDETHLHVTHQGNKKKWPWNEVGHLVLFNKCTLGRLIFFFSESSGWGRKHVFRAQSDMLDGQWRRYFEGAHRRNQFLSLIRRIIRSLIIRSRALASFTNLYALVTGMMLDLFFILLVEMCTLQANITRYDLNDSSSWIINFHGTWSQILSKTAR